MKELVAPLGMTGLLGGQVWLLVLTAAWPPSGAWFVSLLLAVLAAVAASVSWLHYFEEQSIQREILKQKQRLDRPVRRPEQVPTEETPRPEVVQQERVWPPRPEEQNF